MALSRDGSLSVVKVNEDTIVQAAQKHYLPKLDGKRYWYGQFSPDGKKLMMILQADVQCFAAIFDVSTGKQVCIVPMPLEPG